MRKFDHHRVVLEGHTNTCRQAHQLDRYLARNQVGQSTPIGEVCNNMPMKKGEMTRRLRFQFLCPGKIALLCSAVARHQILRPGSGSVQFLTNM